MAAKDWVCGVCRAQNRSGAFVCRVCDAARTKPDVSAVPASPAHSRVRAAALLTSDRVRKLLPGLSILWYAALALTALQWLPGLNLSAMQQPAALPDAFRQLSPAAFGQALQAAGRALIAHITSGPALNSFGQMWQYGLTVLITAGVNPLSRQCAVLASLWALRLTAASLAESKGYIPPRRNRMCFTVLPADFLLTALALAPHRTLPWLTLRVHLLSLLTLQLVAITLVMGLLLLIGACSRQSMTRCLLKCTAAAGLIWFCAALLPIS